MRGGKQAWLARPMRGGRELVGWCPPRESNPDRPLRRREPCPLGQEGGWRNRMFRESSETVVESSSQKTTAVRGNALDN